MGYCHRCWNFKTYFPSLCMLCLNCNLLPLDTEFQSLPFGNGVLCSLLFGRIANSAFHIVNDVSSMVLSALCKQPQVWILFCLRTKTAAAYLPAEKSPIRLLLHTADSQPHGSHYQLLWIVWFTVPLKFCFHMFGSKYSIILTGPT